MVNLLPESTRNIVTNKIEETFEGVSNTDLSPILIYMIDQLPARLLPYMAEHFHVTGDEGFSVCNTDDQKRALLKEAVLLHEKRGTPWALERVLDLLGMDGEVIEWFDYPVGQQVPGHFKVIVNRSIVGLNKNDQGKLMNMIRIYKRFSAHLDTVTIKINTNGPAYNPCVVGAGIKVRLITQAI